MLDKKTFIIGILSLSAVILLAANVIVPRRALAEDAIKDRDYQLVTGSVTVPGGEALYITDSHTGKMAVIVYDPGVRSLKVVDVRPVMSAFPGAGIHH